jgi:hypothetical protein
MAINMVLASGLVKSPALRYDPQSRPEFRFTLEQRDGDFCLWLPCFTPGAAAERLAGELEEGMHICITSGRLAYKKRPTKAGEQSRLEVLVWTIEQLRDSTRTDHEPSPVYGSGSDDAAFNHEAPNTPKTHKPHKPRYGKPRQQPWAPSGVMSEN